MFITLAAIIFAAMYIIGWKRKWTFKQIIAAILCSWGLLVFFFLFCSWIKTTFNLLGG